MSNEIDTFQIKVGNGYFMAMRSPRGFDGFYGLKLDRNTMVYTMNWGVVNMREMAEALGLKSFDLSLPQNWVDERERNNEPWATYVWCYDEPHRLFGHPVEVGYAFLDLAKQAVEVHDAQKEEEAWATKTG